MTWVLAFLLGAVGASLMTGPRSACSWRLKKTHIARVQLWDLATSAYTLWQKDHPGEICPRRFADLVPYTNKKDIRDPWRSPMQMRCAPGVAFGVSSVGPDGIDGTDDDIRSWDPR